MRIKIGPSSFLFPVTAARSQGRARTRTPRSGPSGRRGRSTVLSGSLARAPRHGASLGGRDPNRVARILAFPGPAWKNSLTVLQGISLAHPPRRKPGQPAAWLPSRGMGFPAISGQRSREPPQTTAATLLKPALRENSSGRSRRAATGRQVNHQHRYVRWCDPADTQRLT